MIQQSTNDDVARIASYLKTKYHLDLVYPLHDRSHLPDTITFVGMTKVVGNQKIAVTFALSCEVTAALLQHINFLDRVL
jgi:hypothetical protein